MTQCKFVRGGVTELLICMIHTQTLDKSSVKNVAVRPCFNANIAILEYAGTTM